MRVKTNKDGITVIVSATDIRRHAKSYGMSGLPKNQAVRFTFDVDLNLSSVEPELQSTQSVNELAYSALKWGLRKLATKDS